MNFNPIVSTRQNKAVNSKLTIGQPNDRFEQEADATADQVIKMPQSPPPIQRKCEDCDEEQLQMKPLAESITPIIQKQSEEEEELQMKGFDSGVIQTKPAEASTDISSKLNQTKGSGSKLADGTNQFMSNAFGTDFSGVNIHTDTHAIQMNRSLNARAFTHGSDVYFNKGEYNPGSGEGKHLLAHELTHVVQQGGAKSKNNNPPQIQKTEAELRASFEDELDDFFVNVKNVWPAIRNENDQTARDNIKSDQILERKIRRHSSEMKLLKTYLLLTYQTESNYPVHFREIIDATDRWGTHEARINAVLRGVSQAERTELQQMPGLIEVLEDELSGSELDIATELLYTNIDAADTGSDSAGVPSYAVLERGERNDLNAWARTGFSGKDFSDVVILVREASDYEGGIAGRYILNDIALWALIADEYDPEEVWYLRMIARFKGKENFLKIAGQSDPYIENIWKYVGSAGTKEEELIAELNVINGDIASRVMLISDPWFVPMLEEELSGDDLALAFAAIGVSASVVSDKQKDLLKAIKKKDMASIRTILKHVDLTASELQTLRDDPKILEKMGAKLNGVQLAETSLLLKYGKAPMPANVTSLIQKFQENEVDASDIGDFLRNLPEAQQDTLINEPGIYLMLIDSGLSVDDRNSLLAAIRSNNPSWQTPGAEGTHRTRSPYTAAQRAVTLPVHFASNEIRIPLRFNIDVTGLPSEYEFSNSRIEDWIRAIDEHWNGRFIFRSGGKQFPLVFANYMAVDLPSPNKQIILKDAIGRSWVRGGAGKMQVYLRGTGGDGFEDSTMAHEFGHIIGNPDEYNLTDQDYLRLTGEQADGGRGGTDVKGMMGSHHSSTDLRDRHVAVVLMIVNQVRDVAKYPNPFTLGIA